MAYSRAMDRPVVAALVALCLMAAPCPAAADVAGGKAVVLPGISYRVLASGPPEGAHPTRSDSVRMRYVGRLKNGQVFSTSPDEGAGISSFPVNGVIPGMSAALQLMRVGDRWRITMPAYLAYGPGRPLTRPAPGAAAQAIQHSAIPPNATLVFDVELVGISSGKAR